MGNYKFIIANIIDRIEGYETIRSYYNPCMVFNGKIIFIFKNKIINLFSNYNFYYRFNITECFSEVVIKYEQ